jgi:hypothetical protein
MDAFCRCNFSPLSLEALAAAGPDVQQALLFRHSLLWMHGGNQPIQQLCRITLCTDDASTAAAALLGDNEIVASYDLVAVQPGSERVMQQVRDESSIEFTVEATHG